MIMRLIAYSLLLFFLVRCDGATSSSSLPKVTYGWIGALGANYPQPSQPSHVYDTIQKDSMPANATGIESAVSISDYAFEVCFDSGYLYNTCASVIVRNPQTHSIIDFTINAYTYWEKQMHGNGLLAYIGHDSLNRLWSMEITTSDASAGVFAYLLCRKNGAIKARRTIVNTTDDCADPENASVAEVVDIMKKRMDHFTQQYGLDRVTIDSSEWVIPADNRNEFSTSTEEGQSALHGEKLIVNTPDGTYSWFFEQGQIMCWFIYDWDVWFRRKKE